MTREYQGFSIQNFRKGFDEAVEPWLLPGDAFQVVKNAHVYRGVVEKIRGYSLFAKFTSKTVAQLSGLLNGVNKTFTGTLASVPLTGETTVRATITAATGIVETFTDNGSGVLVGNLGGTGTINYTINTPVGGQPAGYITVTFNSAPQDMTVAGIQYNAVMVTYDSTADGNPIMGIKPYYALDGSEEVIIFDTTRAGKVVPLTGTMQTVQQLNYGITEIPHEQQSASITTGFNGTAGPFTGTVTAPLVPGTVQFLIFNNASPKVLVGTITDNGAGKLVSIATDTTRLDPAANNFINYATGKWTMTFLGGAPPNFPTASYTTNFSSCTYGPYFTGDFTNFFTVANWMGYMFITNAIDAPRYYDGMCVKFLNTSINPDPLAVAPYTLTRVTHLVVYNNRLVLLGAYSNNVPALSTAFWSKIDEPLDFTNNEFEPATTSEPIRAFFLITVNLVVRFANSERILTYTGDPFGPFRWDSTNNLWRCDARYSAINYDSWGSSVGLAAIVGSDGVNIKRVDEIIPDFTLNLRIDEQQPVPSIDQGSIGQCYGQRFDDFKEGWLCYKDYTTTDDQGGPLPSDSVLSFNYIDGTYAVYTFPFSVLGFGRITNTETWGNTFTLWEETFSTWDSYSQTTGALIDLGGDQNGRIYELGFGNSITDEDGNVIPCLMDIITKDFNPFVEEGQYARFGYVDFLVSSNDQTTFRVQFYKDNQLTDSFNTAYQETPLVLTGNTQSKVWKRIYVGAVGKCHTMRIYQNAADFTNTLQNQPIRIHAIVPYFKAAGRIFNP